MANANVCGRGRSGKLLFCCLLSVAMKPVVVVSMVGVVLWVVVVVVAAGVGVFRVVVCVALWCCDPLVSWCGVSCGWCGRCRASYVSVGAGVVAGCVANNGCGVASAIVFASVVLM